MGALHTIEYAIRADLSEPAKEFLNQLSKGMWPDDPDSKELPDEEQITDHGKFLSAMKHFAIHGEPVYSHGLNALDDGVWEFKIARKRMSFFDTPGNGTFEPKLKHTVRAESDYPTSDHWEVPEMDQFLRLGHCFPKRGKMAGEINTHECCEVREEDIAHDRKQQ